MPSMPPESSGVLYVVATPLGNLEDITVRAARLLGEVDTVLAEDTRRTRRLLTHLGHNTPTLSVHQHNEKGRIDQVCRMLEDGRNLALVSDAGTPAISDPGFPLIRAVVERDLKVVPIPGACALATAVCAAGLPTDRIHFIGFLPTRPGRRRKVLEEALSLRATLVLYASPHKLIKDLKLLVEIAGPERNACLCRELTKVHEEFDRAPLGELVERWEAKKVRGEITLVVGPPPKKKSPSQ